MRRSSVFYTPCLSYTRRKIRDVISKKDRFNSIHEKNGRFIANSYINIGVSLSKMHLFRFLKDFCKNDDYEAA